MTTTDELEHLATEYVEHIERSVPAVLVVVRSADELRRAPVVTARITRATGTFLVRRSPVQLWARRAYSSRPFRRGFRLSPTRRLNRALESPVPAR